MPFLPTYTSSTSTRRYRIIFILITTSTLLFTTIGLQSDRLTTFSSASSRYPESQYTDLDPKISLDVLKKDSHLWDYASGSHDSHRDVESDWSAWEWVGTLRKPGYRRPSWGGLRQQGPRSHMRENLKEGMKYLTTFPAAGFNNEVMETCNLIAIALRSNRTPILSPFWPDFAHLQHHDSFISVSEVFDFTDLIAHYKVPIIDLLELKVGEGSWERVDERYKTVIFDGEFPQFTTRPDPHAREGVEEITLRVGDKIEAEKAELDEMYCWNGYLTVDGQGHGETLSTLNPVSIHDTPLPLSAYASIPFSQLQLKHASLPGIAEAISAFSTTTDNLPLSSLARISDLGLPTSTMSPDEPLGCVNRLYYAHMNAETEDVHDDWRNGVGAWDEVGRYLKFQPGVEILAQDLLRDLMDVKVNEEVPPYMAVHIRRTDFADGWITGDQHHYAYQAWQLLREVREERKIDIKHILFTTDEEDGEWLKVLRDMGWIHVDHKRAKTGERLGWWFPTILDSVILSSAKVFLGVSSSTMSILPYRRIIDWHGGVARFFDNPNSSPVPINWKWTD